MPRFYFDFDDDGGSTIDNDGEEFPTVDAAKWEALAAIGDAAKDYARRHPDGRLSIRVRDDDGAILELSVTIETKLLNS